MAMRLAGTVEQSEIKTLAKAFEEKFAANDRVNLVIDVSQWNDITGDAIAEDMKFELGQLDKLSRIPRMAMISDKQFVQAIMKFMSPLVPTLEIKTFGGQEYEKALAFASEMPAAKTSDQPAMKMIETGSPKIIAYEIDGTFTKQDLERVMPALKTAFEKDEKIDVLARIKNFGGVDPAVFTEPSLFSIKLAAINHVRRYAVVGAPGWIRNVVGMVGSMLPIAIRFFNADQEEEAWAWLKS